MGISAVLSPDGVSLDAGLSLTFSDANENSFVKNGELTLGKQLHLRYPSLSLTSVQRALHLQKDFNREPQTHQTRDTVFLLGVHDLRLTKLLKKTQKIKRRYKV